MIPYATTIAGRWKGKFVTVYPSIYPSRFRPGGAFYWSMDIIHVATNFFAWTLTSSVDSLFGYFTLQMCGELRILSKLFENLSSSLDYKKDLKECIEKHYLLMRCRDSLERVFGVLTIWIAVTGALIQCALIFQLTQVRVCIDPLVANYMNHYLKFIFCMLYNILLHYMHDLCAFSRSVL